MTAQCPSSKRRDPLHKTEHPGHASALTELDDQSPDKNHLREQIEQEAKAGDRDPVPRGQKFQEA